jgi:hypothetical protein
MKVLKRDEILAADDMKTVTVSVPEWGGDVIVRTMTGTDRDRFDESIIEYDESGKRKVAWDNLRAKLVAATVVDEIGKPLFSPKDVELLGRKSAIALQRVFAAAQALNGVGDDELEKAEKN